MDSNSVFPIREFPQNEVKGFTDSVAEGKVKAMATKTKSYSTLAAAAQRNDEIHEVTE